MAFWKKSSPKPDPRYESPYDPYYKSMSRYEELWPSTQSVDFTDVSIKSSTVVADTSYVEMLEFKNKQLKKDNEDLLATVETLTKQIKEMDRE